MSAPINTVERHMILVYSPSGVGKSTAVRSAKKQLPEIVVDSLDDMVAGFARKSGKKVGKTSSLRT